MTERTRIGILWGTLAMALAGLLTVGCGEAPPQATWKESTSVPADFPKDVPIYPGATIKVAVAPDAGNGMYVFWQTLDKAPPVLAYLRKELEAQGWTVTEVGVPAQWLGDRGGMLNATRWGRSVSIVVGEKDKEGFTVITYINPRKP